MSDDLMVDFGSAEWFLEWHNTQTAPVNATPTSLPALNNICHGAGGKRGIAQGWYVVIGGGSGHGKSLVACQFAGDAFKAGRKVCLLSLEMPPDEVYTRWLAQTTQTDVRHLEVGEGFNSDVAFKAKGIIEAIQGRFDDPTIEDDAVRASKIPALVVNREPVEDLDTIIQLIAHYRNEPAFRCDFFMIDYLQLVSDGDDAQTVKDVQRINKGLRKWAHKERVGMVCTSQYNNETNKETDKPPTIYGLHGGGSIAHNSELALLLDHSRYIDLPDERKAITFLVAAKNRHGPKGDIPIMWDYRTLTAKQCSEHEWERYNV